MDSDKHGLVQIRSESKANLQFAPPLLLDSGGNEYMDRVIPRIVQYCLAN